MDQATSVRCVRLLPEQPGTTALIQSRDACRAVQRGLLAARISGDGERRLRGIPPPPLQMAFTQRAPVRCVGRRDSARRSSSYSTLRGLYKGHNAPSKTASSSAGGPFPARTRRTRLATGSSPSPTGKVVRCVRAGSQSLLRTPAGDSRHGTAPAIQWRTTTLDSTPNTILAITSCPPGRCRHDPSRHSARPTRSLPFSAAVSRTRHDHARGVRHRISTIRYADGRAVTAATACDTTRIPRTQNEKPLDPSGSRGFVFWRRGWDSNPRYGETVRLISSQVHSTTLPPLLPCCLLHFAVGRFRERKDYRTISSKPTSPFCKYFYENFKSLRERDLTTPARARRYARCRPCTDAALPAP